MPAWFAFVLLMCCASTVRAEPVELRFIIPSGATTESSRLYFNLLRDFETREPEIRITLEPMRSWDGVMHRVRELEAENTSAGLFVAEVSQTPELDRLRLIRPIESVFDSAESLREIVTTINRGFLPAAQCTPRRLCGLPFFRSVPVAYYNLDTLRAAGIDAGTLPRTWDELETLLEALRAKTERPPFFLGGDWTDWLFEATVVQAGGSLMEGPGGRVQVDTPKAVQALEFWKRLKDKKLLERANTWMDTLTGFTSGRYPVIYYSVGGFEAARNNKRFNAGVEMMPKLLSHGATLGGGNLYASARLDADQAAAALKLIRYLFRPETQARIAAETGYFPAVEVANQEPVLKVRNADDAYQRAREQLRHTRPKLAAGYTIAVRQRLRAAIDACLNEGIAPAEALQTAQREIDALLRPSM